MCFLYAEKDMRICAFMTVLKSIMRKSAIYGRNKQNKNKQQRQRKRCNAICEKPFENIKTNTYKVVLLKYAKMRYSKTEIFI